MDGKKNFELVILNQKFTIKSDADEKHVKKVADFVNKKMHEIVSANKAISTTHVAILTALNIADDFYKMKNKNKQLAGDWKSRVEDIIKKVESFS